MQVKKFEARSMKEALEMVKRQLGPDAIILSARDHRKRFGLVGDGSVEITAAVSPETLQKKKFAESRMKPDIREKFLNSPARQQRQIMDQFAGRFQDLQFQNEKEESRPAATVPKKSESGRPPTAQRYIDIDDGPQNHLLSSIQFSESKIEAESAESRIKEAALRAWDALRGQDSVRAADVVETPELREEPTTSREHRRGDEREVGPAAPSLSNEPGILDFSDLKKELEGLRLMVSEIHSAPVTPSPVRVEPHPGARYGLAYEFAASFEKLVQAGLSESLVVEMLQQAQREMEEQRKLSRGLIDGWTAKYILESTLIGGEKPHARVQCFMGPPGSGKTSSLIKMASHFAVEKRKRVAVLTADTFKVGAVDQMRIYSQILNVPFGVIRRAGDWAGLLERLQEMDLIFCDFPGFSLRNTTDFEILKALLPPRSLNESHLVLSTCARDEETLEFCNRYGAIGYHDLVFNHLDEALSHGVIYNTMRKLEKPLHSFGIGPRVPEDFEFASKERLLDYIFKLSNQVSRVRKIQEIR